MLLLNTGRHPRATLNRGAQGPKPGEPGSSHERLMSRICAPALSRSLQQCVYWSGVECGRRSRLLPPSTGEAVLRLLESSQPCCERQKRKRGDAAGEILPVPPLIKEGTQKPPFVKGAARSAGGFGNVAVMKRTFASSIAWLAHSKNSSSWYRQLKIALGLSTLFV